MLEELLLSRHEVTKVKSKNGYIRQVINSNAEWYRNFCAAYTNTLKARPSGKNGRIKNHKKKTRTIIRRVDTIRNLKVLIKHGYRAGIYRDRMMPLLEDYLATLTKIYGKEAFAVH